MKKLLRATALAAAALCGATASQAAAITFSPSSSTINVNESVTVTMSLSGLGTDILSAFDFNVFWSSTILDWSLLSVAGGCAALQSPATCSFDVATNGEFGANGTATLSDAALAAVQADDFEIARFTFIGKAGGTSTIELGPNPDFQRMFLGANFEALNLTIGTAEICVRGDLSNCGGLPGIPEPASYGLAGVALLAASWASRGRRRTVKAA